MKRLVVVLDPGVAVSAAELAAAWDADQEARAAGSATVETAKPGDFFGVLELVVIPLAVNVASSGITAIVGRLMAKLRPAQPGQPDLEIAEMTGADGDHVVIVRSRRTVS
jgi:hypothetical protein